MRHKERTSAGIEERAGKTRERLCPWLVTGDGVACRKHNPVRVKLELSDVAGGEQPVVLGGWVRRDRKCERGLREPFNVASDKSVRGEVHDLVVCERRVLEGGLAGVGAQMDIAWRRADALGDGVQLVRCVGETRQARQLGSVDPGTLPE